jgi:ATP-binding cassette subfamily F protein 3
MKIVLDALTKQIAGQKIVDIDSFEFRSGKKTVIIGRNGCGKTTLFTLIAGLLEADSGRVVREKGALALLEQDFPSALVSCTLFDVCADACAHLRKREEELQALEQNFAGLKESARLRYAELRESFERDGGYDWRREVRIVLEGLGFAQEDFTRRVEAFSGGQRRRALLARSLLVRPEYLLLDEPSNHLDLEGIAWLEDWLKARKQTTLIISHDRHLMDAVADEIVEYRNCRLERYPAPFAAFREERAKRRAVQHKQWKAQQEFIERTEDFIRRNIAGQKTKQAQARRSMLEKAELLEAPERDPKWRLKLSKARLESKELVQAEQLCCFYGEAAILNNISFSVYRGEKIAIIGANGCGKSTLLKVLLGLEPARSGTLCLDSQASIGYFPQEGGELNPENTVLDEIFTEKPGAAEEEMRSLLGAFLFSGDDVQKRVAVLSGGERSRLLLAKIFLRRPNLLIMDEATNHLDLESRVLLENALADYDGSLIFVSHDRAFVNAIATAIWHIKDGRLTRYEGNIDDNEGHLFPREGARPIVAQSRTQGGALHDSLSAERTGRINSFRPGANRFRVEKIEKEIADLEEELRIEKEKMLGADALRDGRVFAERELRCTELQEQLEMRYKEWEEICG